MFIISKRPTHHKRSRNRVYTKEFKSSAYKLVELGHGQLRLKWISQASDKKEN